MALALLQVPLVFAIGAARAAAVGQAPGVVGGGPSLIKLQREVYPVHSAGKVVALKASYSGVIRVGYPHEQEFRMVFDTGSGHVVLPSSSCEAVACLKHRRYNVSASPSGSAVNLDGSTVPEGNLSDQVTIGFGTGKVVGEFFHDSVCLGAAAPGGGLQEEGPCARVHGVMAVDMSRQPFESFGFDGILGLGLAPLAVSPSFSFFDVLARSGQLDLPHFGVFMSANGSDSEIAIGGHNAQRATGPLSWVPAARPEMGHWQVQILAVHVGGHRLGACDGEGGCHGVLDTGTTHLGVPKQHESAISKLLSLPAGDAADCRAVFGGLPLVIELLGVNLTVHPEHYMRQLPLAEGDLGSSRKVKAAPGGPKLCKPKTVPVSMPSPLGPNLFILGEPLLQSYYTVFDWETPRVGFSPAADAVGGPAVRRRQPPALDEPAVTLV